MLPVLVFFVFFFNSNTFFAVLLPWVFSSQGKYELRIDMRVGSQDLYAQYSSFKIGPESDKQVLNTTCSFLFYACARGRDWLESVALLLSVSERNLVDVLALGGAK